ncbi:MAG: hypothetical protein HUJ56_13400, partial [Erysipelotrichaceae bacterium]|nr:hypothetical protein [Erysipelotrichaceae bacterium]
MKKVLIGILLLCLLSGCSIFQSEDDTKLINYQSFYQSILDNDKFLSYSNYYAVSAERTKMDDGSYRYYIFIDYPQVAMYHIKVMAVENSIPYEQNKKMMPSFGVLDGNDYTMIPYQINSSKNYIKGISISGETMDEVSEIKMVVSWNNDKHQQYREYISFTLDDEHPTYVADEAKGG